MAPWFGKSVKWINIVLLGETGVGKSTFINSFVNYLSFKDFRKAENKELIVLIPSRCLVTDKFGKHHIIEIGNREDDSNECFDEGKSATQDVKSYIFAIRHGTVNIRLIDTPGMGDGRGIEQDNINCERILDYIGKLQEIHAICYLFKPTNARLTVSFQYCMTQILSRLDKSASKNLVFIFTNTGANNYGPGDTFIPLRKVINDIKTRPPYVEIPLDENVFCLDNEAFRYLAAVKQKIKFDQSLKQRNMASWKQSSENCNRLIQYLLGDKKNRPLEPHQVQSTRAVNEARRLILQLSRPLAEILQLLGDNLFILTRHKESLELESNSLDELKEKLYMPIVDLEVETLTAPVTVCANSKCAEFYKVGDINKWHYKQRCHDPCYLKNVPHEVVGSPELRYCDAITRTGICKKCDCDFSAHMHVYYFTRTVEKQVTDSNIQLNIADREKVLHEATKFVDEVSTKKMELEEEQTKIVRSCAKFAQFLQNNAITPFCDSYQEYIKYLIEREKSLGFQANKDIIAQLQKLLEEYIAAKQFFDQIYALEGGNYNSDVITPEKIQEDIKDLYELKYTGDKIKELFDSQKNSRKREHKQTEYVHEFTPEDDQNQAQDESETKNTNVEKDGLNILSDGLNSCFEQAVGVRTRAQRSLSYPKEVTDEQKSIMVFMVFSMYKLFIIYMYIYYYIL